MNLELTHPLLLAGLALLPVLVWYFHRSLVDFARWQRLLSLACRALLVVLVVLALAGLTRLEPTHDLYVLFVLDRSLSIGPESRQAADEFVERALAGRGANRAAFLPFAAEPGRALAEWPPETGSLNEQGTNVAAALEVAAASIPPGYVPRLVLLSDGNENADDALRAALRVRVPVSTVPLLPRADPEVQVTEVKVPAQVREGEPFFVEVVVDSNHDDEGLIEVYRGGDLLTRERHKVHKGANTFRFRDVITGDRVAAYRVWAREFQQDTLLDNNVGGGLVTAAGKPRVLVIESDPKLAQPLADALAEEGVQVDVRPARGMPESLADLQNYELLLLSNVPATALSHRQMEIARTYVQDLGGGFIMLGGNQSFGLGGYYKTVLEEILPVRSDFEKEKEKPSLAMVLVIDRSGSMAGQKIELAKEASKSAVELLGPQDQVGVLVFDTQTRWASELRSAAEKGYVLDRISGITADGGTVMYPAMEQAFQALQNATAKYKHVIILTDGISEPGDFQGITTRMAGASITVSTVGVGEDADQNLLKQIAESWGKGRYYFTADPSSVPQIFAQETMTASKSAIQDGPFLPQLVRPTPVLAGIDFAEAPELLAYVITRPKATCELILATPRNDPLLAWWRYGLGMSVAFTSDAKGQWAANWLSWPGYGKFWVQLVRHAMRKSDARGITVQVEQKGRRATVTLDAVDPVGRFINHADTELTLIDPRLASRRLTLAQQAPGRYVAEFDTPEAGAYHLELSQKLDGQVLHHQSRGLVVGYADELRLRPTNEVLLRSIAAVSGGAYDPIPEAVFAAPDRSAQRAVPLWPYLALAAALLLLVDVALRRIDLAATLSRFRGEFTVVAAPRR
jgi:uncharacterized membrane protein